MRDSLICRSLEIVSQQTAGMNTTLRDTLKIHSGARLLLNVAEQAVQGWVNAQKSILDLMTQQSEQAVQATKEASGSPSKWLAALNELIQQTAERAIEAQKAMVEFAVNQNKAVSEAIKRVGTPGTPIATTTETCSVQSMHCSKIRGNSSLRNSPQGNSCQSLSCELADISAIRLVNGLL